MNMAKSRDILRLFLYFPDGGKYNVENSNCEGTEQLRKLRKHGGYYIWNCYFWSRYSRRLSGVEQN